jgi:glycosyltransferase 2 family protein
VVASIGACLGPLILRRQSIRSFFRKLPILHRGRSLLAAYEVTARAVGTNFIALIGSFPSHILTTAMGYCVFHALHMHGNVLVFASILAMVNMLLAIPVSIGGLGAREYLFITFLSLLHIDKEHAFAFSLTLFTMGLLWSLAGLPFYFLYRHETHTPAPAMAEMNPLFSEP